MIFLTMLVTGVLQLHKSTLITAMFTSYSPLFKIGMLIINLKIKASFTNFHKNFRHFK